MQTKETPVDDFWMKRPQDLRAAIAILRTEAGPQLGVSYDGKLVYLEEDPVEVRRFAGELLGIEVCSDCGKVVGDVEAECDALCSFRPGGINDPDRA